MSGTDATLLTIRARARRLLLKTALGRFARRILRPIRARFNHDSAPMSAPAADEYQHWLAQNPDDVPQPFEDDENLPVFGLVVRLQSGETRCLEQLLESISAQTYRNWHLCVIEDGGANYEAVKIVERFAASDPRRVSFHRGTGGSGITYAVGDFVAWIDDDALLNVNALATFAKAIKNRPDLDILYSDHDHLESDGRRAVPYLKPDWSPELLLTSRYFGQLTMIRRETIARSGFLESGACRDIDDLIVRLTERTNQVAHVRGVLYHSRQPTKRTEPGDEIRSLQGHIDRLGIRATVEHCKSPAIFDEAGYKLEFGFDSYPRVTIVIPTKDRLELLKKCLDSLDAVTSYPNYDVVIVDNGSREPATHEYYQKIRHRVISCSLNNTFNFSALVNEGVRHAIGDFVLLLNNDTEMTQATWLHELVGYGRIPGVGAVGAKLLYPNGLIQHAGVVMGHEGLTGHYFQGESDGNKNAGYLNLKQTARNVSAVTGACLLTPRRLYEEMGGFDEIHLGVAWNDVDYCLRLLKKGYRIVFNPHSVVVHHESVSRGDSKNANEVRYMMENWSEFIRDDPYYHPYFSRTGNSYRLRLDPREDRRYFYHRYSRTFTGSAEESINFMEESAASA